MDVRVTERGNVDVDCVIFLAIKGCGVKAPVFQDLNIEFIDYFIGGVFFRKIIHSLTVSLRRDLASIQKSKEGVFIHLFNILEVRHCKALQNNSGFNNRRIRNPSFVWCSI